MIVPGWLGAIMQYPFVVGNVLQVHQLELFSRDRGQGFVSKRKIRLPSSSLDTPHRQESWLDLAEFFHTEGIGPSAALDEDDLRAGSRPTRRAPLPSLNRRTIGASD
jgi:hypothetical protein